MSPDPAAPRPLGRTALALTPLGFGAAPLGGMYEEVADDDARAAVDAAFAAGIGYFDVAPLYGTGLAEQRLGAALRDRPRERFVLSTKVGRLLVPPAADTVKETLFAGALPFEIRYDYTHDGVLRSLDESRRRMGVERIDIVLIHDVNRRWHGDDVDRRFAEVMDGGYVALARLRAEGTIRAIGVGMNDASMCVRFAQAGDFDCFMLAGRYTLLDQSPLDDLLPLAAARGIGILAAAPFNSGILATGAVAGARYFYRDAPPDVRDRVVRIEAVCARHAVPLAAAALQFALGHPAVTSVVAGHRSAGEVDANTRLLRHPVPPDFWRELKDAGLVRADAPVP